MKVHIYSDERYPDYGVTLNPSKYNKTIEISDELYAEVVAAEAAYEAIQGKLAALEKEQEGRKPPAPPEPRLTQAEIDAIKATTPVEDSQAIQAAINAVKARTSKAA